jgi:hypothetical protein
MKRVLGLVGVAALVATASFLAGRASVEADEGVTLVVRHKVASFAKWKPVFDGHEAFRKQSGWTAHEVLADVADPNQVTVIGHIRTATQAKEFGKAPSLKEAMQKGGVQGAPDVTLWKVVEEKKY